MLRAAASSKLIPIAFRARNALANPLPLPRRGFSTVPKYHFTSDHIRSIILNGFDDDIKFNQIIPSRPAAPADFPFKLQHGRNNDITLTRELAGEEIEVALFDQPRHNGDDENQNNAGSDEESPARSVPARVTISKADGKSMKFAANVSSDRVVIERVTTKETKDGEDNVICSQLYIEPESELQMAFRELLATRGIEKSIGEFLYDYMSWKSKIPSSIHSPSTILAFSAEKSQENVAILKKLKKVVEEW